ncbi:MAG: septum formation initiator family protein [Oscillospiraceae bacterium]|nr:septum formation initiator family protein [Oscillospiraceae bacterium]
MRGSRSRIVTRIIVFALIVYAGISLISLRGRIDTVREELNAVKRAVVEMELLNSELEYEIENCNEPDVIADIARSDLGLVLPGEIILYDIGSEQNETE